MAEDYDTNLKSYKLQLEQVEAALTKDPTSPDLLKLKHDLEEVVALTEHLAGKSAPDEGAEPERSSKKFVEKWKPGDKCQALYSKDDKYYEATIDTILEDGTCTVVFEQYGDTEITQVYLLRPSETGVKRKAERAFPEFYKEKPKSKKQAEFEKRDAKKKRQSKKQEQLKEVEEFREREKNKWKSFSSKLLTKTKKGVVKQSIFQSPESLEGRVGVGTCGTGGKPMTKYTMQSESYRPTMPPNAPK